jgi:hypothetical protein
VESDGGVFGLPPPGVGFFRKFEGESIQNESLIFRSRKMSQRKIGPQNLGTPPTAFKEIGRRSGAVNQREGEAPAKPAVRSLDRPKNNFPILALGLLANPPRVRKQLAMPTAWQGGPMEVILIANPWCGGSLALPEKHGLTDLRRNYFRETITAFRFTQTRGGKNNEVTIISKKPRIPRENRGYEIFVTPKTLKNKHFIFGNN